MNQREKERRTGTPVVFAGISLSHVETNALLPAVVRPPVKRGDLDKLSDGGAAAIIDGELDAAVMLQPDEILRAIARGVDVRGSSSIGALRAAELHGSGMAGVGWVYDSYRASRIAGVDEIAVIYDPQSYRPLTIPLVNIRFCLDRLVESNGVTHDEAQNAMEVLKSIELEQRDRRTVLTRLARVFGRQRVRDSLNVIACGRTDIKARDARDLLLTWSMEQAGAYSETVY